MLCLTYINIYKINEVELLLRIFYQIYQVMDFVHLNFSALKLLTDPDNVPAMINCAHGKDRTGIVSAMILACLGRSKEDIALDYAISEVR